MDKLIILGLSGPALAFTIIGALLGFFGLMILIIILVKKRFTSLQIKKDDLSEEEIAKEELDRILVPIDEELVEKTDEDESLKGDVKKD